jgi:hypothetical protein
MFAAMSIYLRKLVRTTPVISLRSYFDDVSPGTFENIDWAVQRKALADALIEGIHALDEDTRDRVFSDVDRIGQFMNEYGRRVLRGVLPDDTEILDRFDALEDVTACALFVLMLKDDTFENALAAVYAQRLVNGRDWTGLDFKPEGKPKMRRHPPIRDFEARLREIFTTDGPPPRIAVDRFTRREPDPAGSGTLAREQFTIYVEAAPETTFTFEGKSELETRIVRPVREAALLFDAKEGTLDIVARGGGKARRHQLADVFVETMLAPGAALAERARRTLALDVLKSRPDFAIQPEDRVRDVEVAKLVLGAPDFGSIATFEVRSRSDKATGGDLYERAERVFGRNGIPGLRGWRVISAKLRITFEPESPKARAKKVTFELKAPDRTNLRDQVELHRRIADVLLARWDLYGGEG